MEHNIDQDEINDYKSTKGNITVRAEITLFDTWELYITRTGPNAFNIRLLSVESTSYESWMAVITGTKDSCVVCGSNNDKDIAIIRKKENTYVLMLGCGDVFIDFHIPADDLDEPLLQVITFAQKYGLAFNDRDN